MSHSVLYDPEAVRTEELPLDRAPFMALADAMLTRKDASGLRAGDCTQIALVLTGHARIVAAEVSWQFESLPTGSELRPVTEQVLQEAERRLSVICQTTLAHAQQRARLVRALYRVLDQLDGTRPVPAPWPPVASPENKAQEGAQLAALNAESRRGA
ncbi:restriction endonuclease [Streptomyces sp. NPDC048155]|uniref:restriction endonuclease n=1 Tax=Streptomyces sp. NPDC048155 TaxID=3154818 RepID=UPI0033C4BA99